MSEEEDKKVTQFQPGQSGNPSGRPKGSKNRATIVKQALEAQAIDQISQDASEILARAIEMAKDGDRAMIKLIVERILPLRKAGEDEKGSGVGSVNITVHQANPRQEDGNTITINAEEQD